MFLLFVLSAQAIHLNLTTENHLWMFPGWFPPNWWNATIELKNKEPCTPDMASSVNMVVVFCHVCLYIHIYIGFLMKDSMHVTSLLFEVFFVLCPACQMREAVKYSIFLDSFNETLDGTVPSDSGLVSLHPLLHHYAYVLV